MPGVRCAVYGCKNNHALVKANGFSILFHRFPKPVDTVSKAIRSDWINKCNRDDEKFNPNNSRICSIHFKDIDYKRDLQNELLGLPIKKLLKKTAVPTLYLESDENVPSISDKEIRSRKKQVRKKIAKGKNQVEKESIGGSAVLATYQYEHDEGIGSTHLAQDCGCNYQIKYAELLQKYEDLEQSFRKHVQSSTKRNKQLTSLVNYYKKKKY